jgi:hypothetical protein
MKILNASEPDLGSSMTEEETMDFLSNTRLFARLETIDGFQKRIIDEKWEAKFTS